MLSSSMTENVEKCYLASFWLAKMNTDNIYDMRAYRICCRAILRSRAYTFDIEALRLAPTFLRKEKEEFLQQLCIITQV